MSNEIIKIDPNWYQDLIDDIRNLEIQGIILTKKAIGDRILQDEDKFNLPEYGSKRIENIAKDCRVSLSEVYNCVQFSRLCLDSPTVSENVNNNKYMSWREIVHKVLPQTTKVYIEKAPIPKGKYNIIYADPNWDYYKGGYKNQSQHYDVLDIDSIANYKDDSGRYISDLPADNCILFLWVTFPILPDSFKIIKSWGFEYSTVGFTWIKSKKDGTGFFFGLGNWTRANAELCIIATKGKVERLDAGISQIIYEPKREHSKKPDCVRDKIVQLVGDLPRIELFANPPIPIGWNWWGKPHRRQ